MGICSGLLYGSDNRPKSRLLESSIFRQALPHASSAGSNVFYQRVGSARLPKS